MAKEITSTDWHLEGVSVEVRTIITSLARARNIKQGVLVDDLLRQSPELVKLAKALGIKLVTVQADLDCRRKMGA